MSDEEPIDKNWNNSDYEIKEQDRFLPIANGRVMKKALPERAKLSKESKECVQECVSEFISFITSQAADRCLVEKRKTLNGEDILWAMYTLGFENYSETLKIYLAKYRQYEQEQLLLHPPKKKIRKKKPKKEEKAAVVTTDNEYLVSSVPEYSDDFLDNDDLSDPPTIAPTLPAQTQSQQPYFESSSEFLNTVIGTSPSKNSDNQSQYIDYTSVNPPSTTIDDTKMNEDIEPQGYSQDEFI
ncbi:CCAAT-binding factor, subunit A (HAP3) [Candida maltosa Xu316]|uniref:CCAAT-binding factor, subunit A (HAP3) n=1 Tax=Candida maltosa (strain Xu316) TaxID=1245528 RepID=M3HLI6_CANMX|nr:CCAAT-binding factor, subunit A (HAP3) [Candida maltosa Xu316]